MMTKQAEVLVCRLIGHKVAYGYERRDMHDRTATTPRTAPRTGDALGVASRETVSNPGHNLQG